MPIWLRKFTFSKLRDHFDKQNPDNNTDDVVAKSKAAMRMGESSLMLRDGIVVICRIPDSHMKKLNSS
jgi:hypothetical protein